MALPKGNSPTVKGVLRGPDATRELVATMIAVYVHRIQVFVITDYLQGTIDKDMHLTAARIWFECAIGIVNLAQVFG